MIFNNTEQNNFSKKDIQNSRLLSSDKKSMSRPSKKSRKTPKNKTIKKLVTNQNSSENGFKKLRSKRSIALEKNPIFIKKGMSSPSKKESMEHQSNSISLDKINLFEYKSVNSNYQIAKDCKKILKCNSDQSKSITKSIDAQSKSFKWLLSLEKPKIQKQVNNFYMIFFNHRK